MLAREGDSLLCLAGIYATECDCIGLSYFLPNQVFRKYIIFSLLTKFLRWPDMAPVQ